MASSEDNNNNERSGSMFGSGWDPLENYGSNNELGGGGSGLSSYIENHQGLVTQYQSGSDLAPKVGAFGSGGFSEMYMNLNPESSVQRVSSGSSPDKTRPPHSNFNPPIKNGDASGDSSGQDEKKQKTEHGMTSRGGSNKQTGKQAKENSDSGGGDYIHVRAKRGQATNSHSLAERVRRERISERMKLLQDLVPGCNKITGKAVMLDEIINYVQSLQHQVEFLSMKLATVNPELNIDIDQILSKDILNSRGNNSNLGFVAGLSSSQHYPQGLIPTTNPSFPPIHPQPVWDNDLHNLLQMGFDSNVGSKATNTHGF